MNNSNCWKVCATIVFCLILHIGLIAQVNVQIQVYEVSTTIGDCDGLFAGDSDPAWWFDGGDVPTFDCNYHSTTCNGCGQSVNLTIIDEEYECPFDFPTSLNYDFHGCENDGLGCALGITTAICDGGIDENQIISFPNGDQEVLFNGTTYDFIANPNIDLGQVCYTNVGGSCPGTWCYSVRIVRTGSFIAIDNDVACDAIPLGTVPFGGSLGDENNQIYQNFCATADAQPSNWTSNNGVWYSFQTDQDVGSLVSIELLPDGGIVGLPFAAGSDLNIQASVFIQGASCNDLIEVEDGVTLIDLTYNKTLEIECPRANATYYILVAGVTDPLDLFGNFEEETGFFGIGIYDDGVAQAADFICNAEYMGEPSPGNPVTTATNLQSNICATQAISTTDVDPIPGFNWSTDADQQQGVWFEFTAPPSGSVNININSTASVLNVFEEHDLDVYVALYTTLDDVCDPAFQTNQLEFVEEQTSLFAPCGLEPIGENDAFDESLDVQCLEPGQSYWVFVDGDENLLLALPTPVNGVDGYFSIVVSDLQKPPAPNNEICNAISLDGGTALTPGQSVSFPNQSNYCADNFFEPYTITGDNSSPDFTNEQGVWYEFIAPSSGAVNIWAENLFTGTTCLGIPEYDDAIRIEISVFQLMAPIDCVTLPPDNDFVKIYAESEEADDLILGGINPIHILNDEHAFVECLNPGETYYVLIDGFSLGTLSTDFLEGTFDLTMEAVNQPAPTANDTPCEAVALGPLVGTHPTLFNNFCATTVPSDPIVQDILNNDVGHNQTVWFTFEATSPSAIVEVLNNGSDNIDLQMGVYESSDGTCTGDMIELQSDYDPIIFNEEIPEVFCLELGEIYYIMVDGVDEFGPTDFLLEGDFQINVTPTNTILTDDNDLICNATSFPGDPFTSGPQTLINQQNICAQDINDPQPSCFDTDQTVWYTFTTPASGTGYAVDISVISATTLLNVPNFDFVDPQIAVFAPDNGLCDGTLTEIACSYDPLSLELDILGLVGSSESLEVQCLEPATTYYIMIDGTIELLTDGFFDITIAQNTNVDPSAANDDCVDAIDLGNIPVGGTIPSGVDYYNFCATADTLEPTPESFGVDQTVWFTFTAPDDGMNDLSNVTINLLNDPANTGDQIDIQAAVFESANGCAGPFTEVDSEYDPGFLSETLELTCLTPGQEYYLMVDGADNGLGGIEGYFQVEIIDEGGSMTPSNDNVCNAIALGAVPDNGTLAPGTIFTNLCASTEANEPNPGFGLGTDSIDQTVWFTFTPPASGNVTIDAFSELSENVDLQLAVYYSANNTCDPAQLVPIEYEWNAGALDETMDVPCLGPGTYYLQVDGSSVSEDLQSGNFTLEIEDDTGSSMAPYNNDICNAGDFGTINTSETLNAETNDCANVELGEPGLFGYAQNTVWYEFIAPPSGHITIEVDPNSVLDLLPEIYLYSTDGTSCDFNDLELVTFDVFPNTALEFILETSCIIPGDTYFIQVDGQALFGTSGQFDITITDIYPNYAATIEPTNNECFGAIPLMVQAESCFIGDGTWDLENYGQPTISISDSLTNACNPNGNCGDTWYCFTLPPTGTVLIEGEDDNDGIVGDDSDLTVIAYTGDCNGLIPLDCEMGGGSADVSYEIEAEPGTKVYLQVFDGGGDDHGEDFALCVSEQCGADNCDFAINMQPDSIYCWNTSSATGEDIYGGEPGYLECGDGSPPEHSIYFSFTSGCNGGSVTVNLSDIMYEDGNPAYIPCDNFLGIETPLDGFTFTVFGDSTPCDNQEDDLIYCEVFTGCEHNTNNDEFSFVFENLNAYTDYIIQIDGGIFNAIDGETGGNVQGTISIEVEPLPEIDSMVVVDSILCFGDLGTVTAIINEDAYPFTFNWDNVSFDSIYTDVAPGWHYLTVTGFNGCEETDSIFLPEPPLLVASSLLDSILLCNADSTTVSASAIGGATDTGGYSYEWNTIPPQTDSLAIVFAGTYTVTVTDDNMCTATSSITITEPPAIIPTIVVDQNVSCFGGSDGSATASGTGGIEANDYDYEWSTVPAQTTATATNLAMGTYTVTLTDDNACTATEEVSITEPTEVMASTMLIQDASCFGGADGSASASGTGGTIALDYQYEWSTAPSQVTSTATDLAAGTYTVTISDDNMCTATATISIGEPTEVMALINIDSDVSCFGGSDGSATASGTGGTVALDYQYEWSTTPVQNTATATGLSATIYTVTITDDNNCTATQTVSLSQPNEIVATINIDNNVSCFSGNDASATASGTGGTIAAVAGDYQYEWSTMPVQNTATATGLSATTYTVTLTDDNMCTATQTVSISQPAELVASTNIDNNVSCFGGSDGSATASGMGGTIALDYQYEWSTMPVQNTATATALPLGTYTVTITDDNMCTATQTAMITEPTEVIASTILVNDVSCFGGSDGSATASAMGGTIVLDYQYEWSTVPVQNTATATGLSLGTYTVTTTDDNNCTSTATISINEPVQISATIAVDNNVSCFGGTDGSVTVTAMDGSVALDYQYEWSSTPSQNTATATNLPMGTYTVTVTDDNMCTVTATATITEPIQFLASITVDQSVSCFGASDGALTAIGTGGTVALDYQYTWSTVPSETTASITGLIADTYIVTITDDNMCTATTQITLGSPDEIVVTINTDNNVSCFSDSDASITASAIGGTAAADYQYAWNTVPPQITATASNLPMGTYTVTVTDDNMCTGTQVVTVTEPNELIASTILDNDVSCFGGSDGSVTASAVGGTAALDYQYEWSTMPVQNTATATSLPIGTYTVTITDDNMCTSTSAITINEPTQVTAVATLNNNVSCFGGSDGSAIVTAMGGTIATDYQYEWSSTPSQTTATATNLPMGTYTVTVTDDNMCSLTTTIAITEPLEMMAIAAELQIQTSCAAPNGSAQVTVTNGAIPYTYEWTTIPVQTTDIATNLEAGTYTVTVTDNLMCQTTASITIASDILITANPTITDATCFGGNDGSILLTPTSVAAAYTYNWSSGFGNPNTGLLAGDYTVTITADNGCTLTETFTVGEPDNIVISELSSTDASCFNSSDGAVSVLVTGGTPPYNYTWDGAAAGQDDTAVNLPTSNYNLTVTDNQGCTQTGIFFINAPNEIAINLLGNTPANCQSCDGVAVVNAMEGVGPYIYQWSNGVIGATNTQLCSGTNTVTVTDAQGCLNTLEVNTGNISTLVIDDVEEMETSCANICTGEATVNASSGEAPYTYLWDAGAGNQTSQTAEGLCIGTYIVTVTDADGCVATATATITGPEPLELELSATDVECFGESNATITIDTAYGGISPYTFSLNNSTIAFTTDTFFNNVNSDLHTVYIQDANGCIDSSQIFVNEPAELLLTAFPLDTLIQLGEDVQLFVIPNQDNIVYTWTPADSLNCDDCPDPVASSTSTTLYTVVATDTINNCIAMENLLVRIDGERNIFVPNVFTPNNDGNNDFVTVFSDASVSNIKTFKIFDRWGEMIFERNNFQPNMPLSGWDGNFNGKPMNSAVFVYYVEIQFIDGATRIYKGDITLVR